MPRKILAGACALAALTPASALAQNPTPPDPGPGVPAGLMEISQTTRVVSGSNAVPSNEKTKLFVTADRYHLLAKNAKSGKLRAESASTTKKSWRYDAPSNTLTIGAGFAKPPVLTVDQEARIFQQSLGEGCYASAGTMIFKGRPANIFTATAQPSGPCRGDANVRAIVDQANGHILRRTATAPDGSFKQVETLDFVNQVKLDAANRPLLKMKAHPGAKIEKETRSS